MTNPFDDRPFNTCGSALIWNTIFHQYQINRLAANINDQIFSLHVLKSWCYGSITLRKNNNPFDMKLILFSLITETNITSLLQIPDQFFLFCSIVGKRQSHR